MAWKLDDAMWFLPNALNVKVNKFNQARVNGREGGAACRSRSTGCPATQTQALGCLACTRRLGAGCPERLAARARKGRSQCCASASCLFCQRACGGCGKGCGPVTVAVAASVCARQYSHEAGLNSWQRSRDDKQGVRTRTSAVRRGGTGVQCPSALANSVPDVGVPLNGWLAWPLRLCRTASAGCCSSAVCVQPADRQPPAGPQRPASSH